MRGVWRAGAGPMRHFDRESTAGLRTPASSPENPDMLTLLGWEWSQIDLDRNRHYGHKNVIFRETADDEVPRRSIAAPRAQLAVAPMGRPVQLLMALADWENRDDYLQIQTYYGEVADTKMCPKGIDTRELPDDCHETAADPATLFEKLDQWGFESIVIPHGNAWGLNTPPGLTFDKQLVGKHHDPDRQILCEVYSGHGNSEAYRDWRAVELAEDGSRKCPEATEGYEPCCRRAGEIIRDRCEGVSSAECDARVAAAQQNYVDASVTGYWTVPGTSVEDWKGCGQCTDCFAPAFDLRPAATAQYALAISNFDAPEPRRFRFGLIGSSDNHFGRGGTGYKELSRHGMTEASGPVSGAAGNPFLPNGVRRRLSGRERRTRLVVADLRDVGRSLRIIQPVGPG